jgi:PEGA domain
MSVARDLIIDQLSPAVDGDHLATWYTQGHSDGLGDRLLMFDNTSAPSWEILRFRPALARDPRFESALRQRMDHLASFQHPTFPLVRPLKGLGHEDGLAVVSTFAPGLRLSEAMKRPRSPAFAVRLLRQLAPAVAALQQHHPGMFHGALDADRIVVTADGRLTIREHMVGAALASLGLSAATLWSEYRVIAGPAPAFPALDSRSDVIQLGLVVLALMAGRRIGPDEYPDKIEGLLDEIAQRNGRGALVTFQSLRYWLERALQLDEYMFDSARDASDALTELRDDAEQRDEFRATVGPTLHDGIDVRAALTAGLPAAEGDFSPTPPKDLNPFSSDDERAEIGSEQVQPARRRVGGMVYWAAAVVAVVAVAEAVFIGRLLYARAAAPPPTPPIASVATPGHSVPSASFAELDANKSEPTTDMGDAKGTTLRVASASMTVSTPSASQRNGGFRVSAPFEVHVLDNERVLGSSTDGPMVAAAGRHEFEFVNSVIGYRVRRVVDIKAGQITSVSVAMPNGTLNINAVPWAAVWIDGNSLGDTPIGNLSVPAGEHEILFRHPQLGERREKAIVRADTATRVTVNLER